MRLAQLSLLAFASKTLAQGPYGGGSNGNNPFNNNNNNNGDDNSGFDGFDGSSSFAGFNTSDAQRIRMIHGVVASVAFVLLFPMGSILMRVIPGRFAWIIHAGSQMVALLVYIVGAAMGVRLAKMVTIPGSSGDMLSNPNYNTHPIIGLVVLGCVLIMPMLGFIHHRKFKKVGKRTWSSWAHMGIGRVAITLGIINGGIGLQLARASSSTMTAYAVVAAIIWLIWVLVALWSEFRRARAERKAREQAHVAPNHYEAAPPYSQHPPAYAPGNVLYGGPPVQAQRNVGKEDIEMANRRQRDTDESSSSSGNTRRGHTY